MAHEKQTIERLQELRRKYAPRSDEYADISCTIFYLRAEMNGWNDE